MKCGGLPLSSAVLEIGMKGFLEGKTGGAVGEVDGAAGGEAEFQGGLLHGAVVGVGVEAQIVGLGEAEVDAGFQYVPVFAV